MFQDRVRGLHGLKAGGLGLVFQVSISSSPFSHEDCIISINMPRTLTLILTVL